MWSLCVMWLAVTAPVALMACGNGCPQISAWRNATTPDGSLVCARIYGDTSCSGFPLQMAINASHTDLRSDLASLEKAESILAALIRPGCHLRLWSESNFHGQKHSSTSYQWEFETTGVLSAQCDCETDNIELLRCEPLVEMVKIQECDFQTSLVGGICPYSVHLQPFRNDNGSIHELSTLTGDSITKDEVSAITTMFPLHFDGRLDYPADDVVEKLVRYVEPRHKLVVEQKVLACGAFAVPTSEVSENVEGEGRWLSYRSANKRILVSTYNASRSKAVADCSERGFVLASFHDEADASFAARIISSLQAMGRSTSLTYWTAAVPEVLHPFHWHDQHPKCLVVWPEEEMEGIWRTAFRCDEGERSVLARPDPDGTWSYKASHDEAPNHFFCEKTL